MRASTAITRTLSLWGSTLRQTVHRPCGGLLGYLHAVRQPAGRPLHTGQQQPIPLPPLLPSYNLPCLEMESQDDTDAVREIRLRILVSIFYFFPTSWPRPPACSDVIFSSDVQHLSPLMGNMSGFALVRSQRLVQ
jgi:hypothetical protein